MTTLIEFAYEIAKPDVQLAGVPGWANVDEFAVDAKPAAGLFVPPDRESAQVHLMLQSLLADRFRLELTSETRSLPIYSLVSEGANTQLKPSTAPAGVIYDFGTALAGKGVTLESLTASLSRRSDRLIVDNTGMAGAYDFEIGDVHSSVNAPDAAGSGGTPRIPLSVAEIVKLLGLKLVPTAGPVTIFTIQHIEKPTAN